MTDALASAATDSRPDLLAAMIERSQISTTDAEALAQQCLGGTASAETEAEVLQWLAHEYGLAFTALENIEPDRALLAQFSARILLKEELLPLREIDGAVEIAVSRLFADRKSVV